MLYRKIQSFIEIMWLKCSQATFLKLAQKKEKEL